MKLFRLTKKGILALAILLVISISSVSIAPKAYSYYQAFRLEHQADILLAQSKYQEALGKYKESQNKWDDVEINEKIVKTLNLAASEENYKIGFRAFNNGAYEEAIEAFLNVDSEYSEYDKARNMLEEAKDKLQESKKFKTQVKIIQPSPSNQPNQPIPTSTPATTPTSDFQQIEALCRNNVGSWIAKQEVSVRNAVYNLPKKLRDTDPVCAYVVESMTPRTLENSKTLLEGMKADLINKCIVGNGDLSVIPNTDLGTDFTNEMLKHCGG